MRTTIMVVMALAAAVSAGIWALAEFGGAFAVASEGPREPIVRQGEPQQPAEPNTDLQTASAPAAPAPAPVQAAPPPTPPPEAIEFPADVGEEDVTIPQELIDALAAIEPAAGASPTQNLEPPATTSAPASGKVEPEASVEAPPAQSAGAPGDERIVQPASVAAAATAAPDLRQEFRSRTVTYNRPPKTLILDRAIDVSLVVNATEEEDAGRDALQGFPGEIVERDVELSDTVSAQLTGVGFDIVSQTVERQKLSARNVNRWQWRVTPTETGTRTLILEIFGYASGSLDAEPLDAYRDDIVVEVQQLDRVIKWAQSVQPVFGVLAALAGALSALFAFLRFRAEKRRKS